MGSQQPLVQLDGSQLTPPELPPLEPPVVVPPPELAAPELDEPELLLPPALEAAVPVEPRPVLPAELVPALERSPVPVELPPPLAEEPLAPVPVEAPPLVLTALEPALLEPGEDAAPREAADDPPAAVAPARTHSPPWQDQPVSPGQSALDAQESVPEGRRCTQPAAKARRTGKASRMATSVPCPCPANAQGNSLPAGRRRAGQLPRRGEGA